MGFGERSNHQIIMDKVWLGKMLLFFLIKYIYFLEVIKTPGFSLECRELERALFLT